MFDKVYIIPTYKCNLDCPHCDIHKRKDNYNEDNFFTSLNNIDSKEYILFGGEPLLNRPLFKRCVESNKITSLSSNLLLLDEEYIELIKRYNLSIATSWNPHRFNDLEYYIWLSKLKLLTKNGLSCIVLITLTEDLIKMDKKEFLSILREIDNTKAVDGIQFEHLVDNNIDIKKLHKKADKWLCEIHKYWDYHMENMIEEQVKHWKLNCSNICTITPDGTIKKGCPQYTETNINEECYKCSLVNICKPCVLQKSCSFPKQLYELINTNI